MADKNFTTNRFETTGEQAEMVSKWKGKYQNLIEKLGKTCTEVRINRTLEHDAGIVPHSFIRDAYHVFIYPPQPVKLAADKSTVIDFNPKYRLATQDKTYEYDDSLVEGRIAVNYDDADSAIRFSTTDDFPEEALKKIAPLLDAAFAEQPVKQA